MRESRIGVFNDNETIESGDTDGVGVLVPVVVPEGVTAIAFQINEYELPPLLDESVTDMK